MFRSIGAVVAGIILAFALVAGIEGLGAVVHPFPPEADPHDIEVCRKHVANCPGWILAVGAVLWGLTAFVSVWVATRLGSARHPAHGLIIGLLLRLAVGFNMWTLPYPVWFNLANVVAIPAAIYFGARIGRGPVDPSEQTANPT